MLTMDEFRERLTTLIELGWVNQAEGADHILADILTTHRIVPREMTVEGVKHGTLTAYTYHRCRCAECRAANAAQGRKRRRMEREKRLSE
jgi:hypothetical protein